MATCRKSLWHGYDRIILGDSDSGLLPPRHRTTITVPTAGGHSQEQTVTRGQAMRLHVSVVVAWTIAGMCGATWGSQKNASTPGKVHVEPSTLHCVAFRWPIKGDQNRKGESQLREERQPYHTKSKHSRAEDHHCDDHMQ